MHKAIEGAWTTTQLWGNYCLVSEGTWDLCFTKEDLTEIGDMLLANKVLAATHAGAITCVKLSCQP